MMTKLHFLSHEAASASKSGRVPGVRIIRWATEIFWRAQNYITYRLITKYQEYEAGVACRISKLPSHSEDQMKTKTFDSWDLISVLSFLPVFRTAGNKNEITKGAMMWLLYRFLKKAPAIAWSSRLAPEPTKPTCCTDGAHERLGSYEQVVTFLPATYVTDDLRTETVGEYRYFFTSAAVKAGSWLRADIIFEGPSLWRFTPGCSTEGNICSKSHRRSTKKHAWLRVTVLSGDPYCKFHGTRTRFASSTYCKRQLKAQERANDE